MNISMSVFYITTPIYYPNARPHIGHAYTTVFADTLARYHRMIGDDTFFLTGTDEHGLKLQRAAEKKGVDPKTFVDEMVVYYKEYWKLLNISYDWFIRTTDDYHVHTVEKMISELHRKGLLYKDRYSGWYCASCEKYYSETEYEVVDDKPHCPIHKKPLEWLEEETYYFKLSEYRDFMLDVLEKTEIVYPKSYAVEVANRLKKEGLRDVSIARPKERVSWGVELPFDREYTVYVWFDALLNYISAIGYPDDLQRFNHYWPAAHHVIGKDILWFHTVIWFSVLKALDIPLPKKVLVHAFLVNRGIKMGKSAGNVISIEYMVDRYGVDGTRYILMRLMNMAKDVDVTQELFDNVYNTELADVYGNLIRRVGVLVKRKLKGRLEPTSVEQGIAEAIENALDSYSKEMERFDVSRALGTAIELLRKGNAYVNETKPWQQSDPSKSLYTLAELIRAATVMLHPVIPSTTSRTAESFGFPITTPKELRLGENGYTVKESPILFKKTG